MTTKKIQIRAIDLISNLGNDTAGVPFRWLESLVNKVKEQVPDHEEASCLVHNAAGLVFSFEHVLTPMEKAQADLEAMQVIAHELRRLLPREGSMSAADVTKMRQLLGLS